MFSRIAASCTMRVAIPGWRSSVLCMTFSAARRGRTACWAWYTVAIPPRPISLSIRYAPTTVSGPSSARGSDLMGRAECTILARSFAIQNPADTKVDRTDRSEGARSEIAASRAGTWCAPGTSVMVSQVDLPPSGAAPSSAALPSHAAGVASAGSAANAAPHLSVSRAASAQIANHTDAGTGHHVSEYDGEHDLPSGRLHAGHVVSAYRIEELLGMGGMG